jgi:hypothetical protein
MITGKKEVGRQGSSGAVFIGDPMEPLVLLQSFFPIAWPAMKMGYRNNSERTSFDLIYHSIGKAID